MEMETEMSAMTVIGYDGKYTTMGILRGYHNGHHRRVTAHHDCQACVEERARRIVAAEPQAKRGR
jgi:hypothetical protein